MNRVYEYNGYTFSAKNKRDAKEYYYEYDDRYNVNEKDFQRVSDNSWIEIMFEEKDGSPWTSLIIPENAKKQYLGEDGYEDYTWTVSAKAKEWAELNEGLLSQELD